MSGGRRPLLTRGGAHCGVVRVRPDRVAACLDGAPVAAFDPGRHAMGLGRSMWQIPGPPARGVGIWNGRVTFHSVEAVEVDAGGAPSPAR